MISSVIAEFNPFHNGHAYLLSRARELSEAVVCVMSGNFVQRGDLAVFDKYKRTEFALKNGADLVIALPVGWSMSTAENFALGGVSLIKNLGICDAIFFGCECENKSELLKTADIILSDEFNQRVKKYMKDGISYALSRQKAVTEISPVLGKILEKPNNILAIEYILAAKRLSYSPDFYAVNRVGAQHNSSDAVDQFMSASAIREHIYNNDLETIKNYLPENVYTQILHEDYSHIKRLDNALLFKIRSMTKEELKCLPDVSEGLHNRIYDAARSSKNFNELVDKIKTKRYTAARIRRILMCAAFGITNDFIKKEPPYIHVLGCTKNGEELIKEIAKATTLPLVISSKDALNLEGFAKKTYDTEDMTSNLYSLSFNPIKKTFSEYTQKVIKI